MEGMQEIGSVLRAEREKRGCSLEQVYRATHITVRFLQCLESGAFEEIPGEVYVKGFLRRYAQYLGLDGEELVRRYEERRAVVQAPPAAPPREKRARRTAEKPRPAGSVSHGGRLLVAAVLVAAAAVATGWALAIWSLRPTSELPRMPQQAPVPLPVTVEPQPVSEQDSEPDAPAQTPSPSPVSVKVQVRERCWFRVVADGRLAYEGELAAGAETTWTAGERLSVRFGNPRGVDVTWNGRSVALGGDEPITRIFTRDGIADPTPPLPSAPPAPKEPPNGPEAGAGAAGEGPSPAPPPALEPASPPGR